MEAIIALIKQFRLNCLILAISVCVFIANIYYTDINIYVNLVGGVCAIYILLIFIAFIWNKSKDLYNKIAREIEKKKKIEIEEKKKYNIIYQFYLGLDESKKDKLQHIANIGKQDEFHSNVRVIKYEHDSNEFHLCNEVECFSILKTNNYVDYHLIRVKHNGNDSLYIEFDIMFLQIINNDRRAKK